MFLEIKDVEKSFKRGQVRAVRGVSFCLEKGRILGVVGESGSGKSTLAKMILRLLSPDRGGIYFEGMNVGRLNGTRLKDFRKKVQVVFQDPFLSLDPRMTVGNILREPFLILGERRGRSLDEKIRDLLLLVELPADFASKYSRELSGGECQRVAIARAVSQDPELIICDEPVSALDCLVRAQILNLFLRLQKERGMAYLVISHDLGVIRHLGDEVLVMKDGLACEIGQVSQIFSSPSHPYTKFLINLFKENNPRKSGHPYEFFSR